MSSVYPWSYYITSGSIAPTFLCGIALIYKDTTDEITKAYIGAMAVCRPMPFTDAAFMEADLAIGRAIVRLAMNEEVDTVIKELQAEVEEIYAAAN